MSMTEKRITNMINIPLSKPGMDTLNMSAPMLMQINPEGKWENCKPSNIDDNQFKKIVQQLVKSNAISDVQNYCFQCAAENQNKSEKSEYVPIIMMPIHSADQCPFDVECETQKVNESQNKPVKGSTKEKNHETINEKESNKKKIKKRGFALQRLTDFDLLSQW